MESKREDGMANMREMRSIRRESFIEAYGIKEVQDEAGSSSSSEDNNYQLNDVTSPTKSGRQSLTVDDIEITDIDITQKQSNANGDMDISLLEFDKSNTSNEFNNNNKDDPFKEYSTPISPPNFAGGATRRKGSHQRRMMQRLGSHKNSTSFGENRRASTGEMDASMTGSFAGSFAGSFGAMSINSFSTSNASGENVEVGNLLFVTDAEMERIMYGDDDSDKNGSSSDTDTSSTVTPTLNASLPPSSTLGTGAFSTVRLAWRRTPEQDNNNVEEVGSSFDHVQNSQEKQDSRRSIVKVESQLSDNSNISFKSKGQLVAVKIIQKSILKQMKTMSRGDNNRVQVLTAYDNIEREIATMKQLQHPNLVRLYEVIDSVESDRLHMVLEYVSLGEILSYVEGTNKYKRMRYRRKVQGLNADGYFNEKAAALYFVDILHGLAYLHRNRICHRDLKPENILLDESGVCKISDFGVSHIFEEEQSRESYILASLDDDEEIDDMLSSCEDINDEKDINKRSSNDNSNIISKRESDSALNMSSRYNRGMLKKTEGTFPFWSPEMCSKDEIGGFSGYSADVWAAGVCLYIFTTGKLPFFSTIPTDLFDLIEKGDVQYDGLDLSDDLKDLLGKLLDKDPSTRAGVGDCLKSKYCADAREERLHQLGDMLSEKHIILSKADVDTALSVTMSSEQGNHFHKVISKRFSAPATARRITAPPQSFSAFGIPKPKSSRRKLGAETTLTETTADATREYFSNNSTMSNESHHNHALHKKISKKKVGDKPKFKLKNLWRRRR